MKIAILCLLVSLGLASALDKKTANNVLKVVNNPTMLRNAIDSALRFAVNNKKKSGELPSQGYGIIKFSATKCGFSNGRVACTASTVDPLTGAKGSGKGLQLGTALKASLNSLFKDIKSTAQRVARG